jgi:hypothetical protein
MPASSEKAIVTNNLVRCDLCDSLNNLVRCDLCGFGYKTAFGLRKPNRSNNVSPHSSSSHLNSSSGCSDKSLETTGVGSSADGVVFESIEQSNNSYGLCHWNQVELHNLS